MAASISARAVQRCVSSANVAEATTSKARAARPVGFPRTAAFGMKASMRGAGASNFMGSAVALRVNSKAGNRFLTVMKAGDNVSTGYATALIDLATSTNVLEDVHNDIDALNALMASNGELSAFLSSPVQTAEAKKKVIASLAKEAKLNKITANFLSLLVDKSRTDQIANIIADFEQMYCDKTDTQVATVTSAVKLESEQQFLIAKKLQELTGAKNIKMKPEVDEKLIGGFVIKYGKGASSQIDMSILGQINKVAAGLSASQTMVA